jgi:signal transduction histidine kinase
LLTGSGREPIKCWEWLDCGHSDCGSHDSEDLRCWLNPHSRCFENGFSLTERLSARCFECPVFSANAERASGKRCADGAVLETLQAVFAESADIGNRFHDLETQSRVESRRVELLSEVGKALQSTMDIDRLLLVILTAVTAGHGLGFNRAFLMLVDEDESRIKGRMAVGPAEVGEADRIWKSMAADDKGLGHILSRAPEAAGPYNKRIARMARRLVLPLDGANKVSKSIAGGESFVVRGAARDPEVRYIAEALGSDHFVIVPLLAEGKGLGAIIADNFVTRREITEDDMRILETFASQAALALLNASLHTDLRNRLEDLHRAHDELRKNHLQILKAQTQVALGGLTSTLIHDLRAPLVSIGLMARSAAADLGEDHAMKARLEEIAEKALEVEQRLDAGAGSAGREPERVEPVDVGALVHDAMGLLAGLMLKNGVEGTVRLEAGPAVLTGSPLELRQLMLNLIQNAVEAMPGGGTLAVETSRQGRLLKINIKDNGPGIPADLWPRVFSAFFTTKPEGLGLGLFSARRIANKYGGKIEMQTEEGVGTCFTVLLPLSRPAPGEGGSGTR